MEWDQTCVFRKFFCMRVWNVSEWVETGTKEETAVVCRSCNDCLNLERPSGGSIKALPSPGRAAMTEQ